MFRNLNHAEDNRAEDTNKRPGICSATSWIQIGYGIWVNLNIVNIGYAFGFTAVAIPQLKSAKEFQPTLSEVGWIASVIMLTAPIGCLASGLILDMLGRKASLVIGEILLCGAWAYITFVKTVNDLIIGRALLGIGVGFVYGSPRIYVTEITLPNMRGVIGAFSSCAMAVGLTIEALLGSYYTWRNLSYFHVVYCLCMAILNMFLPESPYYLLMTHPDPDEVSVLLKKFRSKKYAVNHEIEDMMDYKADNNIRRLTWKEKRKVLLMPQAYKPFCIVVMLIMFGQFSGIAVLQFYAIEILQESKSTVEPHLGNVILGISRLFSSIVASICLYKVGRKPLAYTSYIGVGITAISLGIYIIEAKNNSVFPQVCYTLYILFASLGHYFLPTLVMSEIYPLQIRGLLLGLTSCVIYLMIFILTKIFPYMQHAMGVHYSLIFFGVLSIIGTLFIYYLLPETKKVTLVEIEEYFSGVRSTLRSSSEIKKAQSPKEITPILKRTSQSFDRHNPVNMKKSTSKVRLNLSDSDSGDLDRDIERKKSDEDFKWKNKEDMEDKESEEIFKRKDDIKQEKSNGHSKKYDDDEGIDDKNEAPGTSRSGP